MEDKEYYVYNFESWALARFGDFEQRQWKSEEGRFICKLFGNKTILIDMKKEKIAVAKCRPDEPFNYVIGVGVAYARLTGQPIPKERRYVKLETLLVGQNFTTVSGEDYTIIGMSKKHSPTLIICEGVKDSKLRYFVKDSLVTPKK